MVQQSIASELPVLPTVKLKINWPHLSRAYNLCGPVTQIILA